MRLFRAEKMPILPEANKQRSFEFVGAGLEIAFHLVKITFVQNPPLQSFELASLTPQAVFSNPSIPPMPPFLRGENLLKVPLFNSDLGGSKSDGEV